MKEKCCAVTPLHLEFAAAAVIFLFMIMKGYVAVGRFK
jgi:hypothetical protein